MRKFSSKITLLVCITVRTLSKGRGDGVGKDQSPAQHAGFSKRP